MIGNETEDKVDQDEKSSDHEPISVLEKQCDTKSEKDDAISKKEQQEEILKQDEIVEKKEIVELEEIV